jgi:hypothetical protein
MCVSDNASEDKNGEYSELKEKRKRKGGGGVMKGVCYVLEMVRVPTLGTKEGRKLHTNNLIVNSKL